VVWQCIPLPYNQPPTQASNLLYSAKHNNATEQQQQQQQQQQQLACRAFLSPIIASIVYVTFAPAKDSSLLLRPTTTGMAACVVANSAYSWIMARASASASSGVACAVWPSCRVAKHMQAGRQAGRCRALHKHTTEPEPLRLLLLAWYVRGGAPAAIETHPHPMSSKLEIQGPQNHLACIRRSTAALGPKDMQRPCNFSSSSCSTLAAETARRMQCARTLP
jgi:hypothetical protein